MEADIFKIVLIITVIAYFIKKSQTKEEYPQNKDLSLREVQEMREESFKKAFEKEVKNEADKNDMLIVFMKLAIGSFLFFVFIVLFSEGLKNDNNLFLGGVNTGIPIYIIIISILIVGFFIYLNYKLENLIFGLIKLIFVFILRIALFALFLFCLYSILANIIHFNIGLAVAWTFGAIISFFIFMFSIQ